ncbi:MAG: nitrile hydratase accessory protein [Pseudolabrys sp.]
MSKPVHPDDPGAAVLPGLPRDEGGPVFAEAWHAQAFAMTVSLHARGAFNWPEWAARLGAEIKAAQARGDSDRGDTYYDHWLAALEGIVAEKGLIGADELADRRDAWDRAARATPHGEPIELGREETA